MISVIHKKSDYLKTLKYVLGKENTELINSNMAGTQPSQLNDQFVTIARLNERVLRRCAHIIVSINRSESLSNGQYHQVTQEILRDLGYLPAKELSLSTSQFIAVRHSDRAHEHIHIVTSRIQYDGKSVSGSYDFFKAEVSTRRISAQMGLEITQVSNNAVASRLKKEFGIEVEISPEHQKSIKLINSPHEKPTAKEIVRKAIKGAIIDSPSLSTYIERLEASNVIVLPKIQGEDLLGLTYVSGDVKIAGYQVYRDYSWPKLQSEHGLTYEPERDLHLFKKTKVKAISKATDHNSKQAVQTVTELKESQSAQLSMQPFSTVEPSRIENSSAEVELLLPQRPNLLTEIKNQSTNITAEPHLAQNNSQGLEIIILAYMRSVNKNFIQGRKLSAKWEKNSLQVFRQNSTIAMQSNNALGQWEKKINTLTKEEIEQINQLQTLTPQKIDDKVNIKPDRNKTTYENEI